MKALEILGREHGLIRQYLDNLTFAVEKLERGERPPKEFFEEAVQFARSFVDKYHHFKEEHIMFGQLAQKKGGEFDGPIEALRHQHERGRNHIAEIAASIEGFAEGREIKMTSMLENLAAYVSLLRQHIHREDHVFYPMVEQELAGSDDDILAEAFEEESQKAGADLLEQNRELVLAMGTRLTH